MKKKLLSLIGVGMAVVGTVYGSSVSFQLASGSITNVSPKLGSVKLTSLVVSDVANSSFAIIDTPNVTLSYTNAAYNYIQTYATNQVSSWVNFYGATNYVTNINIIDVTNTMASTVNLYPQRIAGAVNSTTVIYPSLNYYFVNGAFITNTGAATITVTATYQQ